MTDEEMAEEYANKNVPTGAFGYRSLDDVHYDVAQAYLAGLKAGRPKWHKVAYECGFLDGADKANEELKEKLAEAERTRDNLRQIGFPTFQSCKEYADNLNYAKAIIKDLLDNSDEYTRQRSIDFLKEI